MVSFGWATVVLLIKDLLSEFCIYLSYVIAANTTNKAGIYLMKTREVGIYIIYLI
jgi:hypothetical protein